MPGHLLTIASTIQCPHGGQAVLFTSNPRAKAGSAPVLLETDVHPVVGCPFTIGTKYSPCIRIQWVGGASSARVSGTPALVRSSVGQCFSPEGALQGVAIVTSTQPRASAR